MTINIPFLIDTFLKACYAIPVTLCITIASLLIALPLGFFMSLSRIYKVRFLRQFSLVYISFIRSTPIVLQILLVYSLLPSLINAFVIRHNIPINVFDINPIIYAIIVFALNTTAGAAEIWRAALLTVDNGQMEAAKVLGFSKTQTYLRIIIPQSLSAAIPNLCNLTVNLIKSTSLAFIMTVKDLTAVAKIAASYAYNYVEAYLDIFVIYLIICTVTQKLFAVIERKITAYRGHL
ncbi:MAG: amino acid ABC transporter permease [Termitinemataceae bacterium]|nr:MAG: amino acid ABC transporter permease [Termitinemataceae bacterium]